MRRSGPKNDRTELPVHEVRRSVSARAVVAVDLARRVEIEDTVMPDHRGIGEVPGDERITIGRRLQSDGLAGDEERP